MTTITKRLRISLAACAFLLATGAAFATKVSDTAECPGPPSQVCTGDQNICCTVQGVPQVGELIP